MFKSKGLIFLSLWVICIFLTFNKHSKDKQNSYHGVIWSDAAGYYVYNPVWFIYGNNAAAFPDSIEARTGNGFQLDAVKNKVITKYPSGVALMQAPFFLLSHALAKPLGYEADGFSRIYAFGLFFAGILYCCLGLFFISKFLSRYFSDLISIGAPLLFLAGTNLYYYSIDAPGMSHVYSFFLFSVIIYLSPKITKESTFKYFFIFFLALFLAVLARPTNAFIALFPVFFHLDHKKQILERIRFFVSQKKVLLIGLPVSLLVFIPQFLYWKSISGNFLFYSYQKEGFDFWSAPKLLEVWFSANNGLFPYTPLIALSLLGVLLMIKNKRISGYFYAVLFLLISYVFASWWNWWFGCSFGARSFVEYYALLTIPFAYSLKVTESRAGKIVLGILIIFCVYLNLDMEYYYDGCFYGDTWDFNAYFKLLNS